MICFFFPIFTRFAYQNNFLNLRVAILLLVAIAPHLRCPKIFLPLCSLADTDTAPFNFSRTTAAYPGLMLQTSSALLLSKNARLAKTNVCDRFKRTFTLPNVRRDLFLLATCYVSHCYWLAELNRRTLRRLVLFLKRVASLNMWLQRLARKLKHLVFREGISWSFCNPEKYNVSQD